MQTSECMVILKFHYRNDDESERGIPGNEMKRKDEQSISESREVAEEPRDYFMSVES